MDELLGDDRAARAFRAKFPEEVLQESLAGQLWFGAECLAAGSSIMNRESESAAMRPLAKAVTKSLDTIRNLLREQCLRIKTPNSPTLNLDVNDSTERLFESLKFFDRVFAEFELQYVSAMVQVKTKQEHEMQELICVLFSETLQRALKTGHLNQDQVDYFDPALMFSIPRLAIVAGLVIYNKGPLNISMPADQLSEMFRPFRTLLIKIRDLLRTLTANELFQLEKLLCTNEEIHLQTTNNSYICDDKNNKIVVTSDDDDVVLVSSSNSSNSNCSNVINENSANKDNNFYAHAVEINGDRDTTIIVENRVHNLTTTTTVTPPVTTTTDEETTIVDLSPLINNLSMTNNTSIPTSTDWDQDDKELNDNLMSGDCASGYLIPNTNFGNLLQPNEAPLTDRFISSDDEYNSNENTNVDTGHSLLSNSNIANNQNNGDSGISTENTSLDRTPESEQSYTPITNGNTNIVTQKYSEPWGQNTTKASCSQLERPSQHRSNQHINNNYNQHHHHHHRHNHHHHQQQQSQQQQQDEATGQTTITIKQSTAPPLATVTALLPSATVIVNTDNPSTSQHSNNNRSSSSSRSSRSEKAGNRKTSSSGTYTAQTHSKKKKSHKVQPSDTSDDDPLISSMSNLKKKITITSASLHRNTIDTSGDDTSSSLSDGDPQEVVLAIRAAGRMKFK